MRRFLVICLLVQSVISFSQNVDNIKILNYSRSNGLTYTDIQDICQDHDGFIWIACTRGVFRFDGYKFVICNKRKITLTMQ